MDDQEWALFFKDGADQFPFDFIVERIEPSVFWGEEDFFAWDGVPVL